MPYVKHLLRASPVPYCWSGITSALAIRHCKSSCICIGRENIRAYSSKSRGKFSPSTIYSSFVKKSLASESWETLENLDNDQLSEPSKSWIEKASYNARQLKESLAAPPGKDSLDYHLIKSNLFDLLTSLPPSTSSHTHTNGYSTYKGLLETSVLLLLKESESSSSFSLSIQDLCNVYYTLIRNGSSDLVDLNLLPKIFSVIQSTKELTKQQHLESSLEYLKFLDAQQKVMEAEKLLQWILNVYGPLSDTNFNLAIQAVNCPNIRFACLPLLFSSYHIQGRAPSHQALVFALESLKSSDLKDASRQSAFYEFVKLNVIEERSQHTNITALILTLDAFLENRDLRGAQNFLKLFDSSINLSALNFSTGSVEVEFLKLLAVAHMKYSSSQQIVSTLLKKIQDLGVNDTELTFYWSLYSEPDSANFLKIFDSSLSRGIEITESMLNNAIEILIQANHELLELKNLLTNVSDKYGLDSSVETYEILISASLVNNNVELAIQLFQDSLKEGSQWESAGGIHLRSLENLIVAMCTSMSSEVFEIFKIYQKIRTFTKTVGYEAQASLLKLFLSYNYVGDCEKFLEDELGNESRTIPRDAQPKIYDSLYSYALSCQNYKDSWLIYGLSEKYFNAPYDSYFGIMKHFCSLGRPDAALLIFKNMRNSSKLTGSRPPDEAIYSLLFHEFGKSGYSQGVFELHTFFKMDTSIDADTLVLNEIMHAYCELENTQQAVEIWSQLLSFPEGLGPNNDSYTIMLKLCTKVSIQDVEQMWHTLLESGKAPDDQNYRQYIIANCYHGFYVRALDIAKSMSTKGIEPSKDTISALYNWTLLENRKTDVSSWASTHFPEEWTQLLEEGNLKTYLLDESNPNNDSEDHMRYDINSKLVLEGRNIVPKIV